MSEPARRLRAATAPDPRINAQSRNTDGVRYSRDGLFHSVAPEQETCVAVSKLQNQGLRSGPPGGPLSGIAAQYAAGQQTARV